MSDPLVNRLRALLNDLTRWRQTYSLDLSRSHVATIEEALRSLSPPVADDPCREALHVLLELETIRRRIEKGIANEEEKAYYTYNKTSAWIGAAVAFHGEMPQDGQAGPFATVRMEMQGRMPVSVTAAGEGVVVPNSEEIAEAIVDLKVGKHDTGCGALEDWRKTTRPICDCSEPDRAQAASLLARQVKFA